MARIINRLTSLTLRKLGHGLHADGKGLCLQVKNGGRSWILRFMFDRREHFMGLGPEGDVTLAEARLAARDARALLRKGTNPILARQQSKQAGRVEAAKMVTFKQCAERCIADRESEWRGEKNAEQWLASLTEYAFPIIGGLPVQAIDTGLVMRVLEPIWTKKTKTAMRVRARIERVLAWAAAREYRAKVDNPARWQGHLDNMLPAPRKIAPVKNFEAMPYAEVPDFFAGLATRDSVVAKALAFTILTAARSSEARLATAGEIDFANAVWTIPAGRTKRGREHRVPLTKEALALLPKDGGLLFPNPLGKPLGVNVMLNYLQGDMALPTTTVHGYRASFKTWARERTTFESWIAEASLGHAVGDATEAAYIRDDAIAKRRRLMEAWAGYLTRPAATSGDVIAIGKARAGAPRFDSI